MILTLHEMLGKMCKEIFMWIEQEEWRKMIAEYQSQTGYTNNTQQNKINLNCNIIYRRLLYG
jgi:hypothetical protein